MKDLFSIGEMAKLHNTTIKTLRYYDKIGLLKPIQIVESNGYRYYSTKQFEHLNMISYLKSLGFSLEEVKTHLECRDIDAFLRLLKKQKEITEIKIKELQHINNRFQNRMEEIERTRSRSETGVPILKEIKERRIVQLKANVRLETEIEIALRLLENKSNMSSSLIIGGVGLTIDKFNINNNKFDEYNSLFILLEETDNQSELVSTLPEGIYVSILYRGHRGDSPKYYQIVFDFIRKNSLEIIGDSIERTIIDYYISKNPEDYITELQIPVRYLTLP